MKLVTFQVDSIAGPMERLGALDGENVVDLASAHQLLVASRSSGRRGGPALPASMLELLGWEDAGIEEAAAAHAFAVEHGEAQLPLEQVRLRSPLPRPYSIRDFMLFEEHVLNMSGQVPEEWSRLPVHWKGNPDQVFGHDDEIEWPAFTEKLDYELELGAVIGRRGKPRSEAEAAEYIVGYTVFNDWTARDIQFREMSVGLGPGISKDFAISLGPCLATRDDFDFEGARLYARVNDEQWSEGEMGPMCFSFPEVLLYIAQAQELRPGEVIGSGTVGRGCGMELDRWLRGGDVVELEVDGIGVLRNMVKANGATGGKS